MRLTLNPLRISTTQFSSLSPLPTIVSMDQILAHCRVDADLTELSGLIQSVYYPAAVEWAEGATHRNIVTRSVQWVLECFPCYPTTQIWLPLGKTQSVESIQYTLAGELKTLSGPSSGTPGTNYREDLAYDTGGILWPPYNGVWPSTDYNTPVPVQVNFTAGWNANEIPREIVNAILLGTKDALDNPGSDLNTVGKMLDTRFSLISRYILNREYAT
jgi:hypothetical protein